MKNISFLKPVLLCLSLLGFVASCDDKEDLPPLQPPTGVTAVVNTAPPGIKVSWDMAEGADYYSVYAAKCESPQAVVPLSEYAFCGTSGSASFTYMVVEEGKGYSFAVKSGRYEGESESGFSLRAYCLYTKDAAGGNDGEGDSSSSLPPPSPPSPSGSPNPSSDAPALYIRIRLHQSQHHPFSCQRSLVAASWLPHASLPKTCHLSPLNQHQPAHPHPDTPSPRPVIWQR